MPVETADALVLGGAALALGLIGGFLSADLGKSQNVGTEAVESNGHYPKQVSFSHPEGNQVMWVLPSRRELDSKIFGTPQKPKNVGGVGVSLQNRRTNDAGNKYTTTANPTPFGPRIRNVSGDFSYTAIDRTPYDTPESRDRIEDLEFSFQDPQGNSYRVTINRKIPVGPDHSFQGGVIVDHTIHGVSGIGTALQPTQYEYAAVWGIGTLEINGEVVSENRLVHVMTGERVRTRAGKLLTDSELPHRGAQTHLILPPKVVTEDGPESRPVPSEFTLPNGNTQPFIHLNFVDSNVEGIQRISS